MLNSLEKTLKNDRFTVLSKMTVCEGDVMKFQVSPKHGSGQESIIRVVDGMYVTYTDCCVDHGESSNTDDYHEIICMYQLFEGEAQINFKNNRACFIKKNDIVNFAGSAEFAGATAYKNRFVAAGLLCYYDQLKNSLAELNLDTAILEAYYRDVSSFKDVLIYNSDLQFSAIAKQLEEAVLGNNIFLTKIKALEMLHCGMTNYINYKDVLRRKYNRQHLERVAQAKARIDENPQAAYSISELAEYCQISQTYFKKIFRECFGAPPHRYMIQRRLEQSKEMLSQTDLSIAHIAESMGFASSSRFAAAFKKEYGYLPSAYRKDVKR
ncbi:MAG: helix-turn-helix domain-containing protein [Saccharofermentanales bacterium]|jgi:AraC-like DNA-binding protein